jgi:hypothetical protein
MNKLQHLKTCKIYLRKVINYRRNLLRLGYGKPENPEMVKTMTEINYYLGTIDSFDRMMNYIGQQGVRLRIFEIIPKNKNIWRDEYDRLIFQGMILQGKITKQRELVFS